MKFDKMTAFSYWFVHFSVEVLCFYVLETLFPEFSLLRWIAVLLFDMIAFLTQPVIGLFFEGHRKLKPGLIGGVMLVLGSGFVLIFKAFYPMIIIGLIVFTFGNAMIHISGALSTARVSEGRLSESAVFVAGGSFGVITGRMLAYSSVSWILPFIPALISIPLMYLVDKRIREKYQDDAFDFVKCPLKHDIAGNKPMTMIVTILALIVVARGYIGYGLPTGWNRLSIHTVLLFVFMGLGKMLGGFLADCFGARTVGITSCLLSLPILLVSNEIMWLSLIGIALFSMTMAITLGGLFSVFKDSPGLAFGITTVGLFFGSLPTFFMSMPPQLVCNILNVVMSLFASAGIYVCIVDKKMYFRRKRK